MQGLKIHEGREQGGLLHPVRTEIDNLEEALRESFVRRSSEFEGSLVKAGVDAASNPFGIDASTIPGRVSLRIAEAVADAGGLHKVSNKTRAAITLIEEGIFWDLPTRQARKLFQEALGADSFDSILIDAQHKRLMKGFRQRVSEYAKVVNMRDVVDFKTQNVIQVGSFADFPTVAPGSPYLDVQFSDDRATYSVAKYGGGYSFTMEAQVNDDLQALGRMGEKFGMGFQETLAKFVFYTKIDQNPSIYDGKTLFHADHSNDLGASKPLSHDNLEAAVKLLTAQTDLDGQPLNLRPYALIVHPNQEFEAKRLLNSEYRPGTANNDINVFRGMFPGGVIVTDKVTATRYYVVADPALVDTFELGFLGGRREPELFEEAPGSGHMFEFEIKRYKGRLIFGGAHADWRWIVRGYDS